MRTVIVNCQSFSEDSIMKDAVITCSGGVIRHVGTTLPEGATIIDAGGWNIAPGFIDIQVNGGQEHYFSHVPTAEALHDICESSLHFGTTHVLPCLISSPPETILQAIDAIANFQLLHKEKGVLGLHLEGPFLNPAKRGAHQEQIIRKPTTSELKEILRHGKDVIKVMTIAPEQFADDQLQLLLDSDIVLSVGHSAMTYEQAQHYFNKGIHLVTHLYNAMSQMGHREPGIVGAVFDNADVYAPIILDGAHCHYASARIAYVQKKEKLFLISDAAFLGRQVKEFSSPLLNATLSGEFYKNAEGNLAGAAISMVEAVQNALNFVGIPLQQAIQMATINVARAIRMDHELGKIAIGYPSRFVSFNDDFSAYKTITL